MDLHHTTTLNIPDTDMERIVIIGGGFAGINLARKLTKQNVPGRPAGQAQLPPVSAALLPGGHVRSRTKLDLLSFQKTIPREEKHHPEILRSIGNRLVDIDGVHFYWPGEL